MAGIDYDKGTKKIIDPRHQEGCIMIASTQGKNPLTYVEVSPHSSQKIIWQVCMLPRQKERTLIKNIFVDNEKVGQPVVTQQAHEIVSFINDLRTTADLWSQSRIIDLEVMPE